MTRDTLIARVKARFGDDNAEINNADYYCNSVNDAYMAIVASSPYWPFLEATSAAFSTTVGDNELDLPTGDWRILAMNNDTDQLRMTEISGRRTYLDMYPEGSNSPGTPIQYRLFSNHVFVYPWPEKTTSYTIDYAVSPVRMTAGSDEPIIPLQYQDAIVEYALAQAYADDDNLNQYQTHMSIYQEKLAQMKFDLLGARGDSYAQINDTWSW